MENLVMPWHAWVGPRGIPPNIGTDVYTFMFDAPQSSFRVFSPLWASRNRTVRYPQVIGAKYINGNRFFRARLPNVPERGTEYRTLVRSAHVEPSRLEVGKHHRGDASIDRKL